MSTEISFDRADRAPTGPAKPVPARLNRPVFEQRWTKLLAAFPASFPDDAARTSKRALWVELLDAHAWITEAVFRRGAVTLAFGHKGDFLPEPARALEYFRAAALIRDETQKALSPPVDPPSTGDEAMARYRAMVKASTGRGQQLLGRYGRHYQIVGEARALGLRHGSIEMSDYVRAAYGRAVRGEE